MRYLLLLLFTIGFSSNLYAARPGHCGHNNQRACTVFEFVPSCVKNLVEVRGRCVYQRVNKPKPKPKARPRHCGRHNQRPCNVREFIPSCDRGLQEARGRCLTAREARPKPKARPRHCGRHNQRPCNVREFIPSCDRGLVEARGRCLTRSEVKLKLKPKVRPAHCGRSGQKPCTFLEFFPSCESGLKERAGRCQGARIIDPVRGKNRDFIPTRSTSQSTRVFLDTPLSMKQKVIAPNPSTKHFVLWNQPIVISTSPPGSQALCGTYGCRVLKLSSDLRTPGLDRVSGLPRYFFLRPVGTVAPGSCIKYGDQVLISTDNRVDTNQCGKYGCRVARMTPDRKFEFNHGTGATAFYIRKPDAYGMTGCVTDYDPIVFAQTREKRNQCGWNGCRVLRARDNNRLFFDHGEEQPTHFYLRLSAKNTAACGDFGQRPCGKTESLTRCGTGLMEYKNIVRCMVPQRKLVYSSWIDFADGGFLGLKVSNSNLGAGYFEDGKEYDTTLIKNDPCLPELIINQVRYRVNFYSNILESFFHGNWVTATTIAATSPDLKNKSQCSPPSSPQPVTQPPIIADTAKFGCTEYWQWESTSGTIIIKPEIPCYQEGAQHNRYNEVDITKSKWILGAGIKKNAFSASGVTTNAQSLNLSGSDGNQYFITNIRCETEGCSVLRRGDDNYGSQLGEGKWRRISE